MTNIVSVKAYGYEFARDPEMSIGVYLLTECCSATGKGSMAGGQPAVVCRACYEVVDFVYGDWATDEKEVRIMMAGLLSPEEAHDVWERLAEATEEWRRERAGR